MAGRKGELRDPGPRRKPNGRLGVVKTCKQYVNGAFVRSESGKVLSQRDPLGVFVANIVRASRKDLREAVRAARGALSGWSGRSAFNRSQIAYRIAEMVEDRRAVFEKHLFEHAGFSRTDARVDVDAALDRVFWYAGWADKIAQVLGCVNPVASPYFNFTLPEALGVVALLPSRSSPLLGLVSGLMPLIVPGNTCVVLADSIAPTLAVDLAEAIATSDVPPGVINILTGRREEVLGPLSSHMDINGVAFYGGEQKEIAALQKAAAQNVKRVKIYPDPEPARWREARAQSLYRIEPFLEMKTTWHPVGI